MKTLLASCAIAFSTYSRLPMPQVDWSRENMRHTLAFFPLVGAAVGLVYFLVDRLCALLGFGVILRAAFLTAVPLAVTGGIHMDGFCDTVDALSSHAPREKKLEILKDSAAGAFAVIWGGVWLLVYFALTTERTFGAGCVTAAGFVLSRALSAHGVATLPSARAGMGATLKEGSRFPLPLLLLYGAVYLAVGLLTAGPVPTLAALAAALGVYAYYRSMARRVFGGFTGDLAGWFVQVCELAVLAAAVLSERMWSLWS